MTRYVVVTGTDTGVGKTVVTAALVAAFRAAGLDTVAVKPVQTGVGTGDPGDAGEIERLCGTGSAVELVRVGPALAPETAARIEDVDLPTVDDHVTRIRALGHDVVLVEGAGGILVRLDRAGGTILDVATRLGAEVVVVTRETLGTLNHTGLTVDRLRGAGHEPVLVVGSADPHPSLEARSNRNDLPRLTGCRVVGLVPAGAALLSPDEFRRRSAAWFNGLSEQPR
jgi:dethiobiotin synthase